MSLVLSGKVGDRPEGPNDWILRQTGTKSRFYIGNWRIAADITTVCVHSIFRPSYNRSVAITHVENPQVTSIPRNYAFTLFIIGQS